MPKEYGKIVYEAVSLAEIDPTCNANGENINE
jgi:hypothetical protein